MLKLCSIFIETFTQINLQIKQQNSKKVFLHVIYISVIWETKLEPWSVIVLEETSYAFHT